MYNADFFNEKFKNYNKEEGNAWRFNWRACQIHRMNKTLECIENIISENYITNILEIGCASGDFTDKFINNISCNYLGIDISDKAIELCKEKYKEYKNVKFQQGNILDLSLSEKFDLIICMEVLPYFSIEEKKKIMENLNNLLNNNGKILLTIVLNDKKDGIELMRIVKRNFDNVKYKYIYTDFYQKYFEKRLLFIYDILLNKGKLGQKLSILIKKVIRSEVIFTLISMLDIKKTPSHIIIIADNL